jgi:hypothetical protein
VLDRFRTLGIPTSPAMTARELADAVAPSAGREAAERIANLGPVLDAALYGPDPPAEELVARAWDAEAGVADALRDRTGRLERARARIDPRPLVGANR